MLPRGKMLRSQGEPHCSLICPIPLCPDCRPDGRALCRDFPTEEGCFTLSCWQVFLSDSRQGECHPQGSLWVLSLNGQQELGQQPPEGCYRHP